MEKLVLKAILPALFVLTAACKPAEIEEEIVSPFDVVQGSIDTDGGGARGTGTIRFQQMLDYSNTNVKVSFIGNLDSPGSSITVKTHAKNSLLADGIGITFSRSNADRVTALIRVGANSYRVTAPQMAYLPVVGMGLVIEVQNDPGVRIRAQLRDGTLIFDTATPGDVDVVVDPIPADGKLLGLKLSNASIRGAEVTPL